jgi:hypothetical protein
VPVTNIARPVPGQQGVTLRAVYRHKGGQKGGRHAYAGVLRPDVSQEEAVAGSGLRAARGRAAVRGHPREGKRQGGGKDWARCPTVGQKRKKKAKRCKKNDQNYGGGGKGDTKASWHEERKGTEKGEGTGGAGGESVQGRKGTEICCAILKDG